MSNNAHIMDLLRRENVSLVPLTGEWITYRGAARISVVTWGYKDILQTISSDIWTHRCFDVWQQTKAAARQGRVSCWNTMRQRSDSCGTLFSPLTQNGLRHETEKHLLFNRFPCCPEADSTPSACILFTLYTTSHNSSLEFMELCRKKPYIKQNYVHFICTMSPFCVSPGSSCTRRALCHLSVNSSATY